MIENKSITDIMSKPYGLITHRIEGVAIQPFYISTLGVATYFIFTNN